MTALLTRTAWLLYLLSSVQQCAAGFTGISFESITEGATVNLTWDNTGLDADSFPLILAVSLINQTTSGVFGLKTNLSSTDYALRLAAGKQRGSIADSLKQQSR
jgi:hypothetical protein